MNTSALRDGDLASGEFQRIKLMLEAELQSLRKDNDNPKLDKIQTAEIRGRIAMCKEILTLDKVKPRVGPASAEDILSKPKPPIEGAY